MSYIIIIIIIIIVVIIIIIIIIILQQNLKLMGWNSHAHRSFSGNVESSTLSRDNIGREIGCIVRRFSTSRALRPEHFVPSFATPNGTSQRFECRIANTSVSPFITLSAIARQTTCFVTGA